MKLANLLLALIFASLVYGQESISSAYLTSQENANWITKLSSTKPLDSQLQLIKQKITTDSIYTYGISGNPCRVGISQLKTKVNTKVRKANCDCKILFVLSTKKNNFIPLDIKHSNTSDILKLIKSKNIDQITILDQGKNTAIYGTKGKCGVVILSSKNTKLQKRIKTLL